MLALGGPDASHTFKNDTGPDDANHAQDGMLVMTRPGIRPERRDRMHLLDVTPTILHSMGIRPPASMRGSSLLREAREGAAVQ